MLQRGRTNLSPPVNQHHSRAPQPTPTPSSGYQTTTADRGYSAASYQQPQYRQVLPSTSPHDMNKQPMQQNLGPPQNNPQAMNQMYFQQGRPAFYNQQPRQPTTRQHRPPMNMNNQASQQQYPTMQVSWPAGNQTYMAQPQPQTYMMYNPGQAMNVQQSQYVSQPQNYSMATTPPYYNAPQPQVFFSQIPVQANTGRPPSQPAYQQPQSQVPQKRERKPLLIINPETGKSINDDLASATSSTSNTPPLTDNSERATPNTEIKKEVQAQFASQVIDTIIPKATSSEASTPAVAAQPTPLDETDKDMDTTDSGSLPTVLSVTSTEPTPPTVDTDVTVKTAEVTVEPSVTPPEPVVQQEYVADSSPNAEVTEPAGETTETGELEEDEAPAETKEPQETEEPSRAEEPVVKVDSEEKEVMPSVGEEVQLGEAEVSKGEQEVVEVALPVAPIEVEPVKVVEAASVSEVPKEEERITAKPPSGPKAPPGFKKGPEVASITESTIEKTDKAKEPAVNTGKEKRNSVDNKELKAPVDITNQVAPRKDKEDLKYKYREEPWSPIDHEAKKSYDRDFLLGLQFVDKSLEKPDGLPQLSEVILDKPILARNEADRGAMPKGGIVDFTPGYVRSPRGSMGGGGRRSGQRDRGPKPPKVINLPIDKKEDVQLHHAENAWKPGSLRKADDDPEVLKTEELYKRVRSILNKLTPQKFQTLVTQVLDLTIDTEDRLSGIIDLVFEKAIDEPNFSVAYANMCKYLMQVKVPAKDKPNEVVGFRKLLLSRCQREFEKDASEEHDLVEMQKKVDAAPSEEEKKKLQDALEEKMYMVKRRSLGNIRFIGELFKLKMLTEAIMHDCLLKLLKSMDEDSLECLCRLLMTIGKDIDHEKAKPRVDQYFQQMNKIVMQRKTSARVRFMLQDVIDLRQSNWVPRRADNNPKTIAQIHQEAAKEAQEKTILAQQNLEKAKKVGKERGSRDETGWSTVSASKASRIDPSKMKISKQNVDENIQLGPGGRPGAFGAWGRGSSGGGKQQAQENDRPSTPGNRYAALGGGSDMDRGRGVGRGMGSGRESPRPSRGSLGSAASRGRVPSRPSQEDKDRQAAINAARSIGRGSREGSRDNSREPAPKPATATPPLEKQQEMPDETLMRKAKSIMDEFLHINDLKEAVLCVKELGNLSNMHVFVTQCLNHVLERSQKAREHAGNLLHDVVKLGYITVDQYMKGLKDVLEYAEDMEIDVPKIWVYLSELISPMVQDTNCVPLSFLKDTCQSLVETNKAGKLVASILHIASQRLGHRRVGDLWQQNQLLWTDFLPSDVNVKDFVNDNNVQFTMEAQLSPRSAISMETIIQQLDKLIIQDNLQNTDVFDWIEAYVSPSRAKDPRFIRALMTSVCSSAIVGEGTQRKADPKVINMRSILLQRYLDHHAELELQALYALQALVHKLQHPPGLLRVLFDTLYDEDIISEDAFKQWEDSKDPSEQEGKGTASKSVVQFFTWLKEADPEPDGGAATS